MGATCCAPTTPGFRMLTFPDGTQAGVVGLDAIFAAVYSEGMPVSTDTAREIVERLGTQNYIVSSAREQYCDVVIGEYRKYVEGRAPAKPQAPCLQVTRAGRTGLLSRVLKKKR